MSSMKTVHLFPNGQIERGTAKRPNDRPGYRWVNAYSEANEYGASMPMSRRDWFAAGQCNGFRCRFHDTEEAARQASADDRRAFCVWFEGETCWYSVSAPTEQVAIRRARAVRKRLAGGKRPVNVAKVERLQ